MKSKAIQFLEANRSGERLLGILALREIIARLGGITCHSFWRNISRKRVLCAKMFQNSDLEVETRALDGVGTYLAVGDGDVLRMDGIALQGLFALKGAVEHHVGIR